MDIFESETTKIGKNIATEFDSNESLFISSPTEFDDRIGELYNGFKQEHGDDEKVKKEFETIRNSWYAIRDLNPRVTLQDFNLEPIDVDNSTTEQLEEWEAKNLEKLDKIPAGFLYRQDFKRELGQATTSFIRASENVDDPEQGFLGDLVDGTVDLGARFAEGVGTGVVGIFDREGDKIQAVQRFLKTDPNNDGEFLSDLAGGAGSIVPAIGAAIGGAIVGTAINPGGGTLGGAAKGAIIGSTGFNLATRVNEAYRTTLALTGSEELAEQSWLGQIPAVAVDSLSDLVVTRFAKPLTSSRKTSRLTKAAEEFQLAKDLKSKLAVVKKYDKDLIGAAAEGSLGEAIAEPVGDILSAYGLDVSIREGQLDEALSNAPKSALLGGILGGAASVAVEGAGGSIPELSAIKSGLKEGLVLDDIVDMQTGVFKPIDEIEETIRLARETKEKANIVTNGGDTIGLSTQDLQDDVDEYISDSTPIVPSNKSLRQADESNLTTLPENNITEQNETENEPSDTEQGNDRVDPPEQEQATDTEEDSTDATTGTRDVEETSEPDVPGVPPTETQDVESDTVVESEPEISESNDTEQKGINLGKSKLVSDKDGVKFFETKNKAVSFAEQNLEPDSYDIYGQKDGSFTIEVKPEISVSNNAENDTQEDLTITDDTQEISESNDIKNDTQEDLTTLSHKELKEKTKEIIAKSDRKIPLNSSKKKLVEFIEQDVESKTEPVTETVEPATAKKEIEEALPVEKKTSSVDLKGLKSDFDAVVDQQLKEGNLTEDQAKNFKRSGRFINIDSYNATSKTLAETIRKNVQTKKEAKAIKLKKLQRESEQERFDVEQSKARGSENVVKPRQNKTVAEVKDAVRDQKKGNANIANNKNKLIGIREVIEEKYGSETQQKISTEVIPRIEKLVSLTKQQSRKTSNADEALVLDHAVTTAENAILASLNNGLTPDQAIDKFFARADLNKSKIRNSIDAIDKLNKSSETVTPTDNEGESSIDTIASDQSLSEESDDVVDFVEVLGKAGLKQARVEELVNVAKDQNADLSTRDRTDLVRAITELGKQKDNDSLLILNNSLRNLGLNSKKGDTGKVRPATTTLVSNDTARNEQIEGTIGATVLKLQNNGKPLTFGLPKNKKIQSFIDLVTKMFGADVVFFDGGIDSTLPNGFYDVTSGTAFVDVNSTRAINTIIGHEVSHHLETTNPDLFSKLNEVIQSGGALNSNLDGYIDNLKDKGYTDEQLASEFMADVFGTAMHNLHTLNRFRDILGTDNRSLFKRVADWFYGLVSDFNSRLRKELESYSKKSTEDIEAMDALEDVVGNFRAIENVLRDNLENGSVDAPVMSNSYYFDMETRLLKARLKESGEAHPSVALFKSEKSARDLRAKTIGGKKSGTSLNLRNLFENATSVFAKSNDPVISELFSETPTIEGLREILPLLGSPTFSKNFRDVIVEELIENNQYNRSDANFLAGGAVRPILMERMSFMKLDVDQMIEIASEINETFVAGEADGVLFDSITSLSGAALSLAQFWRQDSGISAILKAMGDVKTATTKSAEIAIGDSRLTESTIVELDKTNGIIDQGKAKVAEDIGNTEVDTEVLKRTRKNVKSMENFFTRMIDFLQKIDGSAGLESRKKQKVTSVTMLIETLKAERTKLRKSLKSGDLDTMLQAQEQASSTLDNVDFTNIKKKSKTFKKDESEFTEIEQGLKDTSKKSAELSLESDLDGDPATGYLKGIIRGATQTINDKERLKDVTDEAKLFNLTVSKLDAGEIDNQTAIDQLKDGLFSSSPDSTIQQAIIKSLELKKVRKEISKFATDNKRAFEQNRKAITARKKLREDSDVDTESKGSLFQKLVNRAESNQISESDAIATLTKKFPNASESDITDAFQSTLQTTQLRVDKNLVSNLKKKITATLGRGGKVLRALGVGDYFDVENTSDTAKRWSELSKSEKLNKISDLQKTDKLFENVNPNNAKLLIEVIDDLPTEQVHESINEFLKIIAGPPKQSFYKAFQQFIEDTPGFWNVKAEDKVNFVKKWLQDNQSNTLLVNSLKRRLDKESDLTDSDLNKLSNILIRRFDEATSKQAEPLAKEYLENINGGKKLTLDKMTKIIKLGLLDSTNDTSFNITRAFGNKFKPDTKALIRTQKIIEKIHDITQNPPNGNITLGQALIERENVKLTEEINRSFKGAGTKLGEFMRLAVLAGMYSKLGTVAGVQIASGLSAFAYKNLAEALRVVFDNILRRGTKQTTTAEDIVGYFNVLLSGIGINVGELSTGSFSENGIRKLWTSLRFGDSIGNFFSAQDMSSTNLKDNSQINALSQQFINTFRNFGNIVSKLNNKEKLTNEDKIQMVKDIALFLPSMGGLVFKIMGAIDSGVTVANTKVSLAHQKNSIIRRGLATRQELVEITRQGQVKARAHERVLTSRFPELKNSQRKDTISSIVEREIFEAIADLNTDLEDFRSAPKIARIKAAWSIGSSATEAEGRNAGVFSQIVDGLNDWLTASQRGKSDSRKITMAANAGVAMIRMFNPVIKPASTMADIAIVNTPILGNVIQEKMRNRPEAGNRRDSGINKVIDNFRTHHSTKYESENITFLTIINTGIFFGIIMALRANEDELEDEKNFKVNLEYSGDPDVPEYSMQIGDKVFHVGRGVGGEALAYMIVAKRAQNFIEAVISGDKEKQGVQVIDFLTKDVLSQAVPFIDSLQGDKHFSSKKKYGIQDNDILIHGKRLIGDVYLPFSAARKSFANLKDGKYRFVEEEEYSVLDEFNRTKEARNGWDVIATLGSPVTKFDPKDTHNLDENEKWLQNVLSSTNTSISGQQLSTSYHKRFKGMTNEEMDKLRSDLKLPDGASQNDIILKFGRLESKAFAKRVRSKKDIKRKGNSFNDFLKKQRELASLGRPNPAQYDEKIANQKKIQKRLSQEKSDSKKALNKKYGIPSESEAAIRAKLINK